MVACFYGNFFNGFFLWSSWVVSGFVFWGDGAVVRDGFFDSI